MYIGDTCDGTGLHHMLWEVVANALDEHLAGRCRRVDVTLHDDGGIEVSDDGAGIPIEPDETGKPVAQRIVTELRATPTWDGHYPHTHVGLLGVGLAVVNALSETFGLEVRRDGGRWTQRFVRGVPISKLVRRGGSRRSGTALRFRPDPTIFATTELSYQDVRRRLFELATLSQGLVFGLRARRRRPELLCSRNGLVDLLASEHERARKPVGAMRVQAVVDQTCVDVAIEWTRKGDAESISSFVNMSRTRNHGTHVEGLRAGLLRAVRRAVRPRRVKSDAVFSGLHAVIHVVIRGDPKLGSPTKDRLDEPEIQRLVMEVVERQVGEQLGRSSPAWRMLSRRLAH